MRTRNKELEKMRRFPALGVATVALQLLVTQPANAALRAHAEITERTLRRMRDAMV
jgi:hypothetical protein